MPDTKYCKSFGIADILDFCIRISSRYESITVFIALKESKSFVLIFEDELDSSNGIMWSYCYFSLKLVIEYTSNV